MFSGLGRSKPGPMDRSTNKGNQDRLDKNVEYFLAHLLTGLPTCYMDKTVRDGSLLGIFRPHEKRNDTS